MTAASFVQRFSALKSVANPAATGDIYVPIWWGIQDGSLVNTSFNQWCLASQLASPDIDKQSICTAVDSLNIGALTHSGPPRENMKKGQEHQNNNRLSRV